ncbi:hypothetical protein PSH76_17840 [Pseudomonas sp. FP215]|uniref:hypothetical protein n=1 Tax=Pseudomonas sp. FP215 TaxID=2738126 RepID=UPI0027363C1E|nr:hypothetical protein [Pseudomonas sp. FP215]WLH21914.1 hypothetical protein PSH76_17840 [Pseudomonas sp. FP215]
MFDLKDVVRNFKQTVAVQITSNQCYFLEKQNITPKPCNYLDETRQPKEPFTNSLAIQKNIKPQLSYRTFLQLTHTT